MVIPVLYFQTRLITASKESARLVSAVVKYRKMLKQKKAYVCLCVCACASERLYVCECASVFVWICVYEHAYVYVRVGVSVCAHACLCVHEHGSVFACVHAFARVSFYCALGEGI